MHKDFPATVSLPGPGAEGTVSGVYLDYNGSAPLDPRVLEAMLPYLTKGIGNASSSHRFGRFKLPPLTRHARMWQISWEAGRGM